MKCPACKSGNLYAFDLEPGLRATVCERCAGHWIPYPNYLRWLETTGVIPTGTASHGAVGDAAAEPDPLRAAARTKIKPTSADIPATVAARVRLCPGCGRFLSKVSLGHGVAFEVDRCGGCGGVWCDAGEWVALRDAAVHDRLHLLFSDSWQSKVKEEAARRRQEERIRSILGDADFARVRDFKRWLDAHAHRLTMHAYLTEDHHDTPRQSGR